MNFFERISKGMEITRSSFEVLGKNKELLIFPILSGISMLLIMASLFAGVLGWAGWNIENIPEPSRGMTYVFAFIYYVINYFVVVFFNMALVHCTRLYYEGDEVTVRKGLEFSMSRIGTIFSWALLAATVGTILKAIQENAGIFGKIITGLIGLVWNVATFFVIPILAYEKTGPIDAVKRSAAIMKDKWGESLGSGFGMGIISFLAALCIIVVAVGLSFISPWIGIPVGVLALLLLSVVMSAAQTVFVSTVYQQVTGNTTHHINEKLLDGLFVRK